MSIEYIFGGESGRVMLCVEAKIIGRGQNKNTMVFSYSSYSFLNLFNTFILLINHIFFKCVIPVIPVNV